jgi:hypothetical protein
MSDRPIDDQADTPERVEMELRARLMILEQRLTLVLWIAVTAHVAAAAIGAMIVISRRRAT